VPTYSPIQSFPIVRDFVFVVLVGCHAFVLLCSYALVQSGRLCAVFVFVILNMLLCAYLHSYPPILLFSYSPIQSFPIVRGFWNFDLGVGGRSPTPDHLRPHFPNPSHTLPPFGTILSHANSFFPLAQFFPIRLPFTYSLNRATLPVGLPPAQCPYRPKR
jgi:hypothetical protein